MGSMDLRYDVSVKWRRTPHHSKADERRKGIEMSIKKFEGYDRITKTEKGKTGLGIEASLVGVTKKDDMPKSLYDTFIKGGFKWMMPMYFDEKGNKVAPYEKYAECRKGFFWINCESKKEQTQRYNKMAQYLVEPEEEKVEKVSKGLIKVNGILTNALPLEQLTKKELILLNKAALGTR